MGQKKRDRTKQWKDRLIRNAVADGVKARIELERKRNEGR